MHTWWIDVISSISYGWVLWSVQLYADATLQSFFVMTSIIGWIHWLKGQGDDILPVRRTQASHFFPLLLCAVVVAGGCSFSLRTFANAWAPWLDSLVLTFSVLAQFMLTGRRIENWFVWLAVDTLVVSLHMTRDLNLTVGSYFLFWTSAWHGLCQWHKELQAS